MPSEAHPERNSATPADELLALLREQRSLLLRSDAAALAQLETGTSRIEQALARIGVQAQRAGTASAVDSHALPSITLVMQLREELQANRSTLAALSAGNRRALNALFGEPPLYGK